MPKFYVEYKLTELHGKVNGNVQELGEIAQKLQLTKNRTKRATVLHKFVPAVFTQGIDGLSSNFCVPDNSTKSHEIYVEKSDDVSKSECKNKTKFKETLFTNFFRVVSLHKRGARAV